MTSMNYTDDYIEKRLTEMVLESISSSYHLTEKDAKVLVDKSSFLEILKDDPDFIGHYPPEYWADYIIEERDLINGNK